MRVFSLSAVLLAIAPGLAQAAPPEVRSIVPPGLQRGVETQVTVYGPEFAPGMQLVVGFPAEIKLTSASKEVASFTIKPAKDVPVGIYPARVRTSGGASNMVLLAVHDLPRVVEVEPNSRLHEAQRINWPCMITGSLGGRGAPRPNKDVDIYKFAVKAGQRLTFASETRRAGLAPDLFMRLRDPKGRELASCDDVPGQGIDPRIDYTFKQAGDYTVEVHFTYFEYGGRIHNYLLKIGDFNYVRSVFPLGGKRGETVSVTALDRDGKPVKLQSQVPADPRADHWLLPLPNFPASLPWRMAVGDLAEVMEDAESKSKTRNAELKTQNSKLKTQNSIQTIAWPAIVNGRIGTPDEMDRYRLLVKPGQKIRISVEAFFHGSHLDGVLRVYDPARKVLAANDNRGDKDIRGGRADADPDVNFTVPDGVNEVTVTLEDGFGRGGADYPYRMTIEPGGPDFLLFTGTRRPLTGWPENDALNLPVGQPVKMAVRVVRLGYDGAIQLNLSDPPPGVTATGGLVPAGKPEGEITITATAQAPASLFEVGVVGVAQVEGKTITRDVVRHIHVGEPASTNLRWDWRLTRLIGAKVENAR